MNKKTQMILWAIILVIVCILVGGYIYINIDRIIRGNVHPEVTFEIQDYGKIKMELYPEYAPNTVTNFIRLAEKGYYDNKVFYGKDEISLYAGRNSEGDAENPKTSLIFDGIDAGNEYDYEYEIQGEFIANGYEDNTLKHEKGIVTLIRNDYTQYVPSLSKESYNSGNAQLGIIMGADASNLNGSYAAFGKVTEGLDILENIYNNSEISVSESTDNASAEGATNAEAETEAIQKFANYPVITSATVDTKGVNFGDPTIEEAFDYESYIYNLMSSYYGEN